MCAALTADGFPSRYVRVLGPTAPYPLTSNVVVVTQAVRELFGSSLSSDYAPAVLATFGSADASITVRVIAPRGAAAYRAQLARIGPPRPKPDPTWRRHRASRCWLRPSSS